MQISHGNGCLGTVTRYNNIRNSLMDSGINSTNSSVLIYDDVESIEKNLRKITNRCLTASVYMILQRNRKIEKIGSG